MFSFGAVITMDQPFPPIDRVFLRACENNKPIDFALARGADIFAVNPDNGYTALHYAAKNNNESRMAFLIVKGLDIDAKAHNGDTPRGLQMVNELFECINNPEVSFELFCKKLELFLKETGGNINTIVDANERTLLHYAVVSKPIEWVQFLLDKKADINCNSKLGGTPIYMLFSCVLTDGNRIVNEDTSGRFEKAQFLIKNKADLNILGPDNRSVLQAAIQSNSSKCIRKILEISDLNIKSVDKSNHNALYDLLHTYVREDIPDLLNILFEKGCKPVIDVEGVSLMHEAMVRGDAMHGDTEIIKKVIGILLKNNVGVNDKDMESGRTPLHYAARFSNVTVVRMLLDAGAEQIQDNEGKTPQDLAKDNKKNPYVGSVLLRHASKKPELKSQSEKKEKAGEEKKIEEKKVKEKKGKKEKKQAGKQRKKKQKNLKKNEKQNDVEKIDQESQVRVESTKKPEKLETKQKASILERVQEKVVQVLTGQKQEIVAQKTYAAALGLNTQHASTQVPRPEEKRSITLVDNHLTITASISRQTAPLMITQGQGNNPLAQVHDYSDHVLEKMARPSDIFHNFSHDVEENLGSLATVENLGKSKRQYTIPATVTLPWGKDVGGAFKFIVRNGQMVHRFFNPEKKKDKQLLLPLPLVSDTSGKDLR